MNIIDKFCLNRVKKIQEKQKKIGEKRVREWEEIRRKQDEFLNTHMNEINEIIYRHLKTLPPLKFKVGDVCIPDRFNVNQNFRGYDWGQGIYLLTNEYEGRNITVKIVKSEYDLSYAYELGESYLNNLFDEGKPFNPVVYENTHKRAGENTKNGDFGICPEVYFEVIGSTEDDFRPTWGLPQDDFLLFDTRAGNMTFDLYERMVEYNSRREILDKEYDDIHDDISKLTTINFEDDE